MGYFRGYGIVLSVDGTGGEVGERGKRGDVKG